MATLKLLYFRLLSIITDFVFFFFSCERACAYTLSSPSIHPPIPPSCSWFWSLYLFSFHFFYDSIDEIVFKSRCLLYKLLVYVWNVTLCCCCCFFTSILDFFFAALVNGCPFFAAQKRIFFPLFFLMFINDLFAYKMK